MSLSQQHETEITTLSLRYGNPKRVTADLPYSPFDPLTKTDRIGEVCMVVRRLDGRLITARKVFYPPQGYRLLTGGIGVDEPIEHALLRETQEETGLDVVVQRFLAVIEYRYGTLQRSSQRTFYTFAFLLDEVGGVLSPQDEEERIEEFHFIYPQELLAMAETLEHIDIGYDVEIGGRWHDWGMFRAIVHRVVFDTLR